MIYRGIKTFKEQCGYDIDGVWYPRVTKIVDIKSKPALYRYYAELGSFEKGENIKEKSANEGTLIHDTMEKIMVGEPVEIDPSIRPSVDAARQFIEDHNIQIDPEFVEKRVVNKEHRYAGTVDSVALIEGRFGVLDIKTSLGIYRDYSLQISAYMDALRHELPGLQTRWILRIDQFKTCNNCRSTFRSKGGRDKVRKPYPKPKNWESCPEEQHDWSPLTGFVELKEFPYWQNDFKAFMGAKILWEWENEYWLKRIGYL
tara:strand:- start:574 stop:1347 length:774 start_codon:yes stop_codon:yes gene_type:complete